MNKVIKNVDFLLSQPLRSKKQYFTSKIIISGGIVLCFIIFTLTIYYWNTLTWYIKGLMAFLLMLLSPDIEDIKFIIKSYDSYYREWKQHNSDKT